MEEHVRSLKATGIYGRFDLNQTFDSGINIIYGKNGAGKTTFLHILANVLNGDFERFKHLDFDFVEVAMSNGDTIKVVRDDQKNSIIVVLNAEEWDVIPIRPRESSTHEWTSRIYKFLDSNQPALAEKDRQALETSAEFQQWLTETGHEKEAKPDIKERLIPVAYFPAFRTMIEAWASTSTEERSRIGAARRRTEGEADATKLARRVFGSFVPKITYPSPVEIEEKLTDEIREAVFRIARTDEQLLSESFINIFGALSDARIPADMSPEKILSEIRDLYDVLEEPSMKPSLATQTVYSRLRKLLESQALFDNIAKIERGSVIEILQVYRDSLQTRVDEQKKAFSFIDRYLASVNNFLEGKKLEKSFSAERRVGQSLIKVAFADGSASTLRAFSSGERQIVTLIYAATHMNEQRLVLIDEPELSLHVDWQRMLLSEMVDQMGRRQIIACTHSPVIAADYPASMKELVLNPSRGFQKNLPQS